MQTHEPTPFSFRVSLDDTFRIYHRLMPFRVREVLIVASPYDAFILEDDARFFEFFSNSYRGLNLDDPPSFTMVDTPEEGLQLLAKNRYDLVVVVPRASGADVEAFSKQVKQMAPGLPIVLILHSARGLMQWMDRSLELGIDKLFVWSGNWQTLHAIIRWHEDRMNVARDTSVAMVRVLIVIEDSPMYYSSLLPILYDSIIRQTQKILEDSLNDEHNLLKLRARPKILLAGTYEDALDLYRRFEPYVMGIFSDVRFPREGEIDPEAGISLLREIKREHPDLPTLLMSSEVTNQEKAWAIQSSFQDKNSQSLHRDIRRFLVDHLGFGDFVFRAEEGYEIARASNLRTIERVLTTIPDESLLYHVTRNHFSLWLMARSEILLASKFQKVKATDFETAGEIRNFIISNMKDMRSTKRRGVVEDFRTEDFDSNYIYLRMGGGSLGGKARGLAFMVKALHLNRARFSRFANVRVTVPKTMVISTDFFDAFLNDNELQGFSNSDCSDEEVSMWFRSAELSTELLRKLRVFLTNVSQPLAVRSSSLLEDNLFQPYAGLYRTYMLPNCHPDVDVRLQQLATAIKLIYGSIFFKSPRAFSRATLHRTEEEKMAIIVQEIVGQRYGDYYYPTLSGTAQSHNFYPVSHLKASDGIACIAVGLGKAVVEGEQVVRFCPRYPEFLPQFSGVDSTLHNAQRHFYCLRLSNDFEFNSEDTTLLEQRDVADAFDEGPLTHLASTFIPEDNRIRDGYFPEGTPVLTFANILKYKAIPVCEIIQDLVALGREGLGTDVEIEFAVTMHGNLRDPVDFHLLQVRPMMVNQAEVGQEISDAERERAFCFSTNALGPALLEGISDVVYVRPKQFSSLRTTIISREISRLNAELVAENVRYLLVGPGRWGSADRYLGVPVGWGDISGVAGIVEAATDDFRADPSQGTHFFQNVTALGIVYLTVDRNGSDVIHWDWLESLPAVRETEFARHVRLPSPLVIRVNSLTNEGVILGGGFTPQ